MNEEYFEQLPNESPECFVVRVWEYARTLSGLCVRFDYGAGRCQAFVKPYSEATNEEYDEPAERQHAA